MKTAYMLGRYLVLGWLRFYVRGQYLSRFVDNATGISVLKVLIPAALCNSLQESVSRLKRIHFPD